MYDNRFARTRTALTGTTGTASADSRFISSRRLSRKHWQSQWRPLMTALVVACVAGCASLVEAQVVDPQSVVRKISGLSDKLELTTNSSRILTLDKNIPRVQVNNPELLAVTPLSATQVQISAKKAGVTQVNLWDEEGNIHTVDVMVYGDARELEVALQTQFPHSSIKVYRYSESLVLKGFVDRPDYVSQIMRLAEDYAPKVINNITVGGVQQVLLKVRVMEVSRTKLRTLGVDWAYIGGSGDFAINSVSGLISSTASDIRDVVTTGGETFSFGIVHGDSSFFGVIRALEEMRIAKTLSEPNLMTVSGRPAQFLVGGETPILVPQSLGTTSIEYKPFGTQIDFVPIVLGNGNIRLEVRPSVSDLDFNNGIVLNEIVIPGFRVRRVDTAAELQCGQTLALAGLVQERVDTVNRGISYLKDVPILGVPFRRTEEDYNEIELLIMVTPEFVDGIDACEAPCGGPGYATTSPNNCDLYCGGHVEVPAYRNPIRGMTACGECGGPFGQCGCGADGCANGQCGHNHSVITNGLNMPGGVGYEGNGYGPTPSEPTTVTDQYQMGPDNVPPTPSETLPGSAPADLELPPGSEPSGAQPSTGASAPAIGPIMTGQPAGAPRSTAPRPYSPTREPVFVRNTGKPDNRQQANGPPKSATTETGLIGPVGYDAQ
jgi:pilus assembly protein CpaC